MIHMKREVNSPDETIHHSIQQLSIISLILQCVHLQNLNIRLTVHFDFQTS